MNNLIFPIMQSKLCALIKNQKQNKIEGKRRRTRGKYIKHPPPFGINYMAAFPCAYLMGLLACLWTQARQCCLLSLPLSSPHYSGVCHPQRASRPGGSRSGWRPVYFWPLPDPELVAGFVLFFHPLKSSPIASPPVECCPRRQGETNTHIEPAHQLYEAQRLTEEDSQQYPLSFASSSYLALVWPTVSRQFFCFFLFGLFFFCSQVKSYCVSCLFKSLETSRNERVHTQSLPHQLLLHMRHKV